MTSSVTINPRSRDLACLKCFVIGILVDSPLGLPVPRDTDFARLKDGVITRDHHFAAHRQVHVNFVEGRAETPTTRDHLSRFYRLIMNEPREDALWFGTNQEDESTGPLIHPFARWFAPLTHSRASGKVNDQMFQNDLVLSHSGMAATGNSIKEH